ncbi:hypothetical protein CH75_17305 [Dyella jiangningensis]|nr:hypothetical protein CH75_17305 [Dyella jiangningensis]
MDFDRLSWLEPWRPLGTEQEALGLQRQLEREITGPHPLFGRCATVKGRRIDRDDVLVVLGDGSYANVHLVWGSSDRSRPPQPSPFAAEYPTWFLYGGVDDFSRAMQDDAREYGDE